MRANKNQTMNVPAREEFEAGLQDKLIEYLSSKGCDAHANGSINPSLAAHLGIASAASSDDIVKIVVLPPSDATKTSPGLLAMLHSFCTQQGCRVKQGFGYLQVARGQDSYEVNTIPLTSYGGKMPFDVLVRRSH